MEGLNLRMSENGQPAIVINALIHDEIIFRNEGPPHAISVKLLEGRSNHWRASETTPNTLPSGRTIICLCNLTDEDLLAISSAGLIPHCSLRLSRLPFRSRPRQMGSVIIEVHYKNDQPQENSPMTLTAICEMLIDKKFPEILTGKNKMDYPSYVYPTRTEIFYTNDGDEMNTCKTLQ